MTSLRTYRTWAALSLLILLAVSLQAAPTARSKHVQVEIVPEVQALQPGTPFTVALRFKMDPGWHTYWVNPGDAGKPIEAFWTLPDGATAGPIRWPYPSAFRAASLSSYGFEDEVTLLVEITPPASLAPGASFPIRADLKWLECEKVCLPARASVDLSLPVRAGTLAPNTEAQTLFVAARAKVPGDGSGWKAQGVGAGTGLALTFAPPAADVRSAMFFSESMRVVEPAAPQVLKKTDGGYSLELIRDDEAGTFDSLAGVLVAETASGTVAVQVRTGVQTADALPTAWP